MMSLSIIPTWTFYSESKHIVDIGVNQEIESGFRLR